jgi:hypothetical protein
VFFVHRRADNRRAVTSLPAKLSRVARLAFAALAGSVVLGAGSGPRQPVPAQSAVTATDLQALRRGGDVRAQRHLVWQVISAMTDSAPGDDRPPFESWHGEDAVFADAPADGNPRGVRGFSRATFDDRAEAAQRGGDPERGDVPVLTYALYNDVAYEHIRGHQLNSRGELERLRRVGGADGTVPADRSIPSFPVGATVLKTVWWPIAGDGVSPLPVWDPERNPIGRAGNDYLGWPRVVAVDPTGAADRPASVRIDFAGRRFSRAQRVAPRAFYRVAVDADMAARLMRDRSARKTALVVLGRPIRAGDALVLVGANLATKAPDDWVWAALWWHDRPDEGPYAADRPDTLKAEWRNYLMQVAFDSTQPAAADGGPHVCFNPWLEGRFPDGGHGAGPVSNCMTCHQRASYPPVNFLPVTRGAPDLAHDAAYAPDRLRTEMLWSLALHAQP